MIIAREVESTIFRDIEADRGQVDVDVAEGVVRLRGEVPTPDLMNELEGRASRVPQVRRVENLLRTPAPAPEPATPEAQQADPAAAGTVLLAPDGPERRGDDPGPPTGRPEDALEPAGRPGGDGSAGQNEPGNAGPGNDRSH